MSFKKICFVLGAVTVAAGAAVTGYMIKRASDKRRQSIKEEFDDAAKTNSNKATEDTLTHIEKLLNQKFGKKVREEDDEEPEIVDVSETPENKAENLVKTGDE